MHAKYILFYNKISIKKKFVLKMLEIKVFFIKMINKKISFFYDLRSINKCLHMINASYQNNSQ
jgi:hypothetical protein